MSSALPDEATLRAPVPVAKEVVESGLNLLRRSIRGNKNAKIRLVGFKGAVLEFEAYTIFRITHHLSRKTVNGRLQGHIVGNEQNFDALTTADIEGARYNTLIHELTIGRMLARRDLGFGTREHIIQLPQAAKQYIAHVPCGACQSHAQTLCAPCKGQGRVLCNRCHGTRDLICPTCRGQRVVRNQQGSNPCTKCKGRGKISCTLCQASGQIQCASCRATGKQSCAGCGGTGWHSILAGLTFQAQARFIFDQSAMPKRAAQLITQLGHRLVTQKMAIVERIENPDHLRILHDDLRDDEFLMAYRVRLPFGTLEAEIDGSKMKGTLIGLNGMVVDFPPYLDKIIAQGAHDLSHAARTGRSSPMRKAMRQRLIREAVQESARFTPAKVARQLQRAYPCGLSKNMMNRLAEDAQIALRNLTRHARSKGVVAGLSIASVLYALYFCSALRAHITTLAAHGNGMALADFFVFLSGMMLTVLCSQYLVRRALMQKLGKVAGGQVWARARKKKGGQMMRAALITLCLYFAVIEIAPLAGQARPDWYEPLRNAVTQKF